MPYAALLETVRRQASRLHEDPGPLPPELELQALWFAGAFGREFRTSCGKPLRIIQFGEWNHAAGPDFLRAAIDLDGTVHHGPLEIDTHPGDWEQHGHAQSPAFRKVILHVTFLDGAATHFTRSIDGRDIPRLVIPAEQRDDALNRPVLPPASSRPGRCSHPLASLPDERVDDLLAEAARFRLRRKARQIRQLEDCHGFEEALWQLLARALGYGPNKLAMTLLGQRATRRILRDLRPDLSREALLFGLAGFLEPDMHEHAPDDSRRYLESLWQYWWKLRPDHEPSSSRALPWSLSGVRPLNHPHRRLGALAACSAAFSKLARPAQRPGPANMDTLRNRLVALSHPFWNHHYTLRSGPAKRTVSLFGKARANEFLANYYIPRWSDTDPAAAWKAFRPLPAAPPSDPVRRAAIRLFGNRPDLHRFHGKLWQQQALLQIHRDFCLRDASGCADCPFPEQLADW